MITKQLVDQYKGKIYVDSIPDQGSTFTIELELEN
jgi:signal transduction histidine kinase